MRYFIMVLFLIIFIGCDKKDIKIGVVLELSGKYSDIANQVKRGIELGVDEINENVGINGKKIKLIIKDNEGNITLARKIDKELIDKNIKVIIGHITSNLSKNVVDLFNNSNTILFSPTTSTTQLSNIDDNFIRIQPAKDINSVKKLLTYIKAYSNKINIIYDLKNKSYAQSIINSIKKSNLIEIENSIGFKDTNFDYKYLTKKLDTIPVFIIASTKDSANIVKNLRINGYKSLISVSGSSFSKDFIKLAKQYSEGVLFVTSFNSLSQNPKFLKFKKDFIYKFGYEPSTFETKGYETIMVLKQVLDKKDIKKSLINKKFDGLQGEIFINRYGDTIKEPFLFVVHNGEFLEIM